MRGVRAFLRFATILAAFNTSMLLGQSSTGAVLGTVRDPTGAAVPETQSEAEKPVNRRKPAV
ncbi:MAG TPA: hypothetical protein VH744_13530, partial [Terriglobales bacterium]